MRVPFAAAGTYIYRFRVVVSGNVVAQTHAHTVVVTAPASKPAVTIVAPVKSKVGAPLLLSGKATGVPAGTTVQRQRLINGVWQVLGTTTTKSNDTWAMTVTPPKAANYTYRVALIVGGKVVALSKSVLVKVVA